MEIKTKYNINDEVYFIHDNKILHKEITSIDIRITRASTNKEESIAMVEYTINLGFAEKVRNTFTTRLEFELFSTKEELLKTL